VSIKLNDTELCALMGLSDLQFRVYVAGLRPYMNYATGIVGQQRRISYQGIHEDVYVEPTVGTKARGKPSRFQTHRILKALERAGLISILSEDRRLILKCLLADTDESVQNKAAPKPHLSRTLTRNKKESEIPLDSETNKNKPHITESELPQKAAQPPVSGIRKELSTSVDTRERVGSRLPPDWTLPLSWQQWAELQRPDLDIPHVAETFRDHWIAKPGKDGRKADWQATWRNWVRREKQQVTKHEENNRVYRSAVSENERAIQEHRAKQSRQAGPDPNVIEGQFSRLRG
jgi:hypothetical protein